MDPRKHTSRHIIIALPEIKDKERVLKAAREKETVDADPGPEDPATFPTLGTVPHRQLPTKECP